jgi:hypothetical protein
MHPPEDPVDDTQSNFILTGKISIQDAIKAALGKKRQNFNATGVFSLGSDNDQFLRCQDLDLHRIT